MKVLSLCQQLCPEKIVYATTDRIGYGVDGEVFSIEGSSDQVIKYCCLYDIPGIKLSLAFNQIQDVLSHLCESPARIYARVYSYSKLGCFERINVGVEEFILYYYVMEKLYPLSEDECRVFHTIVSHEDRGIIKDYSREKQQNLIRGMGTALDFDSERVMFFCDNLKKSTVQHLDLHERNIMKDCYGNFKLVDLDRSILKRRKDNEQ